MNLITIKDFEEMPSNYVWLNNDRTLVIDSQFDKFFMGNKSLLLCCIEDNITDDGIDYYQAIRDYLAGNCTNIERKMSYKL